MEKEKDQRIYGHTHEFINPEYPECKICGLLKSTIVDCYPDSLKNYKKTPETEKKRIIREISEKIQKTFCDHGKAECDMLATEIYSYVMQTEKIKKMSTGKCDHEFTIFEDDSYYPEYEKQRCGKCRKIKIKKKK